MARRKLDPEQQQSANALMRRGIANQKELMRKNPELTEGCERTIAGIRKQLKCNHDYEPLPKGEADAMLRDALNPKKKIGKAVERCIHCCTIWIL